MGKSVGLGRWNTKTGIVIVSPGLVGVDGLETGSGGRLAQYAERTMACAGTIVTKSRFFEQATIM